MEHLPFEIVVNHILPKLPIDTRLALNIPPNKFCKSFLNKYEYLCENKNNISFIEVSLQENIRYIDFRIQIKNKLYSHLYYLWTGDELVFLYGPNSEPLQIWKTHQGMKDWLLMWEKI